MVQSLIPSTEELAILAPLRTDCATGKIRLIKAPVTLTPGMDTADLEAEEADFSGYAEITLTAVDAAYLDPNGGVTFVVPTQQFQSTTATPYVGNDIYGGWMEDAGGDLLFAFVLAHPWPMQAVGNAMPITIVVNLFGPGSIQVLIAAVPQ